MFSIWRSYLIGEPWQLFPSNSVSKKFDYYWNRKRKQQFKTVKQRHFVMISNHLLVCALKIQPLAATVTAIHRASYFVRKKSVKPLGGKSSKLLHGQQQMWTENSTSWLLAAGASKTGKVGIAIGSNGDIIVFSRDCLGVKRYCLGGAILRLFTMAIRWSVWRYRWDTDTAQLADRLR